MVAVVPAYQAAQHLPHSLPPLIRTLGGDAVIVVDPGSEDDTALVARRLGAQVVELGRRAGPAEARNRGVEAAELTHPEVVLFIDADCVAHADTVERVRAAFHADAELVALTGSYDDTPTEENFASLYMNLRHHFVHQNAARENAGFWAGCGAVRRDAFLRAGGFDAERYPRPMIEDIELGGRLRALGPTRLDPDLLVKHRKRWSVTSVVSTDIFQRALPWSRLITETGALPNDLNLRLSARLAAAVAPFALLGLIGLPFAFRLEPMWLVLMLAPVLLALILNSSFVRFLARRSLWLAGLGFVFHQLHLTYSAVTYAAVRSGLVGREKRTLEKSS